MEWRWSEGGGGQSYADECETWHISKMNAVKGEADGVRVKVEGVGSNGGRGVDMPAVGEGGMYGEAEGMENERSIEGWVCS